MVLGCGLCCEPLLWAKHPKYKAEGKKNPRDRGGDTYFCTTTKFLDKNETPNWNENETLRFHDRTAERSARPKGNLLVGIQKYQPMVAKCGHIFHKGCLKNFVTAAPLSGIKPECPVCLKQIAFRECLNVYFDAVPDTSHEKAESHLKEINDLEFENCKLRQYIDDKKAEGDGLYGKLVDTQSRARSIGEEISKKEKDIKTFAKYSDEMGGVEKIQEKLNVANQRIQALGMQNTHLACLIEEHAKAQLEVENERRRLDRDKDNRPLSSITCVRENRRVPTSKSAQNEREERELIQRRFNGAECSILSYRNENFSEKYHESVADHCLEEFLKQQQNNWPEIQKKQKKKKRGLKSRRRQPTTKQK